MVNNTQMNSEGHAHFSDEKSGWFNEKSTQIFSIQDLCQTNILHEGHVMNSSFFLQNIPQPFFLFDEGWIAIFRKKQKSSSMTQFVSKIEFLAHQTPELFDIVSCHSRKIIL